MGTDRPCTELNRAARTNIAEALNLALALFPADTQKRIVLLSDGGEVPNGLPGPFTSKNTRSGHPGACRNPPNTRPQAVADQEQP